MSLVLQSSGGGQITIQEPTTASNFTQTLPAVSGTVLTTGNIPAGSVLQVINATVTGTQSTTSTGSYVDVTGLNASITPTSASNKILVTVNLNTTGVDGNMIMFFNLVRGSTTIISNTGGGTADSNDAWGSIGATATSIDTRLTGALTLTYLDSPSTTSATTYKVQFRVNAGTGYVNRWAIDSNAGGVSAITLMEIAA